MQRFLDEMDQFRRETARQRRNECIFTWLRWLVVLAMMVGLYALPEVKP